MVQLLEEAHVDIAQRIVGSFGFSVGSDLRIGDRPVDVGNSVHGGDLQYVGYGQQHLIVGPSLEISQIYKAIFFFFSPPHIRQDWRTIGGFLCVFCMTLSF